MNIEALVRAIIEELDSDEITPDERIAWVMSRYAELTNSPEIPDNSDHIGDATEMMADGDKVSPTEVEHSGLWEAFRKERDTYQTLEDFAWSLFKERGFLLEAKDALTETVLLFDYERDMAIKDQRIAELVAENNGWRLDTRALYTKLQEAEAKLDRMEGIANEAVPVKDYDSWRISYQSSEQAARGAYRDVEIISARSDAQTQRIAELEKKLDLESRLRDKWEAAGNEYLGKLQEAEAKLTEVQNGLLGMGWNTIQDAQDFYINNASELTALRAYKDSMEATADDRINRAEALEAEVETLRAQVAEQAQAIANLTYSNESHRKTMESWRGRAIVADELEKKFAAIEAAKAGEPIAGFAHEIWAAAQLAPEEGIADGADRVGTLLIGLVANARSQERERILKAAKRFRQGSEFIPMLSFEDLRRAVEEKI